MIGYLEINKSGFNPSLFFYSCCHYSYIYYDNGVCSRGPEHAGERGGDALPAVSGDRAEKGWL